MPPYKYHNLLPKSEGVGDQKHTGNAKTNMPNIVTSHPHPDSSQVLQTARSFWQRRAGQPRVE
eukprot:11579222-Prorocentrum_lima.AAC.1